MGLKGTGLTQPGGAGQEGPFLVCVGRQTGSGVLGTSESVLQERHGVVGHEILGGHHTGFQEDTNKLVLN